MRRGFLLVLVLLAACGPMLYGSAGSSSGGFYVVVHNTAPVTAHVSISVDTDGYASLNSFVAIPAKSEHVFLFGQTPNFVNLHNPSTWGTGTLYWYDQFWRRRLGNGTGDYDEHARSFEVWYP